MDHLVLQQHHFLYLRADLRADVGLLTRPDRAHGRDRLSDVFFFSLDDFNADRWSYFGLTFSSRSLQPPDHKGDQQQDHQRAAHDQNDVALVHDARSSLLAQKTIDFFIRDSVWVV